MAPFFAQSHVARGDGPDDIRSRTLGRFSVPIQTARLNID